MITVTEVNEKVLDKYLAELKKYRKEDQQELSFILAAEFAARVLPLFEAAFPADDRPRKAIQAARDFANGKIPLRDLAEATRAAFDASCAAYAAAPEDDEDKFTLAERAANCAAKAAGFGEIGPSYDYVSVLDVVSNTAKAAVDCAACSSAVAARIAANNAGDSWNAAWSAGWNAGRAAECDAQEMIFKKYLEE